MIVSRSSLTASTSGWSPSFSTVAVPFWLTM